MDVQATPESWQTSEYLPLIYIGMAVGIATFLYAWMLYRHFKYRETLDSGYAISAGAFEIFLLMSACLISSKYPIASSLLFLIATIKIATSNPKLSSAYYTEKYHDRRRNRISNANAPEIMDENSHQNQSLDKKARDRKSA